MFLIILILLPPERSDVDPENMNNLMGMGFDERMAKKALQETVRSPENVSNW